MYGPRRGGPADEHFADHRGEFGYRVLEARDAEQVLAAVDAPGVKVDLLIADMVIGRGTR
jgi:hypothetical protein